jgi:hypothetical protein
MLSGDKVEAARAVEPGAVEVDEVVVVNVDVGEGVAVDGR